MTISQICLNVALILRLISFGCSVALGINLYREYKRKWGESPFSREKPPKDFKKQSKPADDNANPR